MQHELEVSTKQAIFVDSSISDTIRTCIVLGNHRAAVKVKTEFKVCGLIICLYISNKLNIYSIFFYLLMTYHSILLVFLSFSLSIRFLRKDGIGLKFLHLLQEEIGMLWKSSLKRRNHQLVVCLALLLSLKVFNFPWCNFIDHLRS